MTSTEYTGRRRSVVEVIAGRRRRRGSETLPHSAKLPRRVWVFWFWWFLSPPPPPWSPGPDDDGGGIQRNITAVSFDVKTKMKSSPPPPPPPPPPYSSGLELVPGSPGLSSSARCPPSPPAVVDVDDGMTTTCSTTKVLLKLATQSLRGASPCWYKSTHAHTRTHTHTHTHVRHSDPGDACSSSFRFVSFRFLFFHHACVPVPSLVVCFKPLTTCIYQVSDRTHHVCTPR